MAEHKPLPPTHHRLQEARKKGEVVVSGDITSTAVYLGALLGLWMIGANTFHLLQALWLQAMAGVAGMRLGDSLLPLLQTGLTVLAWAVLPMLGLVLVCAVAGAFFQVGGLMAWQRLVPDAKRLNPGEGLKRMFSTRSLVNLAKVLLKTVLLAALLWVVVKGFVSQALQLGYARPAAVLELAAIPMVQTCAWAAVIYIVMSGLDYVHQRFEFMKQHRMSIDEVRREHKDQQGDPLILSKRRGLQFEMMFASLADRIQWSSAVVHSARVAVALQYLGPEDLPRVVARGEGEMAAQIRRQATELLVPMTFEAQMAEQLYAQVPLDEAIPKHLFAPVSALLRWASGE